jgi:hypothetical protein
MSTEDSGRQPTTTPEPAQQTQQTPVQQPVQAPVQTQTQPQQQNTGSASRAAQEMLDAINSLPERIVASLREAAPQQQRAKPATTATAVTKEPTTATSTATAPAATEPGSTPSGTTRLAKWWFS